MFIRKKKNRSGSFSVQIIEKINRKNKVLKTVGVGKTIHEVELLVRIARFEMDQLRSQPELFIGSEDIAIDAFMAGLSIDLPEERIFVESRIVTAEGSESEAIWNTAGDVKPTIVLPTPKDGASTIAKGQIAQAIAPESRAQPLQSNQS